MLWRFICVLCIALLCSCSGSKESFIEDSGEIFHTRYTIKYQYTHSLKNEIERELARFDDSLNPFKAQSIISKVNNNEDVIPDSFFVNVFNRSQEISGISDGLFDITVSPLVNAWGFGFKNMDSVTPHIIDSLRAFVGYKKINLKGDRIVKTDARVQINTSAIAKGYSVDVVANLLKSKGIKNFMVEIGGEIVANGFNSKGECWHIGIDKPVDNKNPEERIIHTIAVICDKAVATSGNYRNFYVKNGHKYAHTIDPRTGYPAENNTLSATVIASNCMTADAYATVFMLADTARIRQIAGREKLEYMLILSDKSDSLRIISSANFPFLSK